MSLALVMIKPWSIQDSGEILAELYTRGHRIKTRNICGVPPEVFERHYEQYRDKPFFRMMVDDFGDGAVVVAKYECYSIGRFSELKIPLRERFACETPANSVGYIRNALHISQTDPEAMRELAVWRRYLESS